MSAAARTVDHRGFHEVAVRMTVVGAMAGLVAHVAGALAPVLGGGVGAPLPLAAIGGAVVLAAAAAPAGGTRASGERVATAAFAAALAAAGLVAARRGDLAAGWGAALFATALGLVLTRGAGSSARSSSSAGADGRRRLAIALGALAAGAAAIAAARFVALSLGGALPGPAWLGAAAAGAGFGAVALLGVAPRHLGRAAAGNEATRALLARGHRVADGDGRIASLAAQLVALERQAASAPAVGVLAGRAADLERRLAATTDALARAEYEQALHAIGEQLREVRAIEDARERVVARLHRALEEGARQELAATSTELDAASQALLETDGDEASPPR